MFAVFLQKLSLVIKVNYILKIIKMLSKNLSGSHKLTSLACSELHFISR